MNVDTADYEIPEATLHSLHDGRGFLQRLRIPAWEKFYEDSALAIFEKGGRVVDIGGGLRIDERRGNRLNKRNKTLFQKYMNAPKVDFKITDYTDKYQPDFVEDIHELSFENDSVDGLFCIAVLEHVYDPKKAAEEIVRVLKKGGKAMIYVPFLYRYHAHQSDYKDYFRYTKDGIAYLFRGCERVTICPVRGVFESLLKITPLDRFTPLRMFVRAFDQTFSSLRKVSEKQTSGYHIVIQK